MESFGWENAFGILQQQHVHCRCKIHTQNAFHNIPPGKTQKAFLQLHKATDCHAGAINAAFQSQGH